MATDPNRFRPYSTENITPHSGQRVRPYEVEEFEGSETAEGIKSGVRDFARFIPQVGKLYSNTQKRIQESNAPNIVKKAAAIYGGLTLEPFLKGASATYDAYPEFFGRSHADVKREEGKPLPKSVTDSTRYKIGEFIGMDLPFTAIDFASGGATKAIRMGAKPLINKSLRSLNMKATYSSAAYKTAASLGKNATAGVVSKELEESGLPIWASNLIGLATGKYAVPHAVEKSGIYLLQKGYNYMMKNANKTTQRAAQTGITPTWANSSDSALSEIALGVLQKDLATRNIMKDFVASQDKEFAKSLMNIVNVNKDITDDASNFLTDILSTKEDMLATQENAVAAQEKLLGDQTQANDLANKAAKTEIQDIQEAATQIVEDLPNVQRSNTQPQRQQITEQSTQNLPTQEISVSDQVIGNAARNIRAEAKTPEDQEASQLIDSIPVTTEAPTQAVEAIYDGISPRIGQPEAGELYRNLRQQAYEIAIPEKRQLYQNLSRAAQESEYQIPLNQFTQLMQGINQQITALTELPFRSPQQQRALQRLQEVQGSFNDENAFIDMGDGINLPVANVPSITRFWEARKSFGQSINWRSNIPGEKILKEQYHRFNNVLERQMQQAGLLDMYNEANQMYITRFLPLEQGTNGRVRFMNPQEAGRVLNLEAINDLSRFLPLNQLNPLRRHAIERVVGLPRTGEILAPQIQKLENVRRYLTPNEQAQFNALGEMDLIQARVAGQQLGEIERFLENNRDNLSNAVIKNLERVADELRANMDLPIEYITGRAEMAQIERLADQQYETAKGLQNQQKTQLKREVRNLKATRGKEIEERNTKQKELNEKYKELNKEKKNIKAQKERLQKSLLGTILQQDTNRALLTNMSSPEGINEVKELFGVSPTGMQIFNELKLLKAQKIFENAASINAIAKLLKNENSKILLRELLPSDMFSKLEDLSKYAGEMQTKLRYFVNQSNTEVQRSNMQQLREMGGAFLSLFTKSVGVGLGRLAAKAAPSSAKIALAKAMTNPEFLKKGHDFLMNLKRNPNSKQTAKSANDWVNLLGQYGVSNTESINSKKKNNNPQSIK